MQYIVFAMKNHETIYTFECTEGKMAILLEIQWEKSTFDFKNKFYFLKTP